MEGKSNYRPVACAGKMSFLNMGGVDVGSLEAREGMAGFIQGIKVEKGMYFCHYAISEDGQRVEALMIVSESYPGETLETSEKIGTVNVALSGVVGFYSSPKKEYTMKQLGEYVAQLEKEHPGKCWVNLNSKQFMAPTSQGIATKVPVFVHRNRDGLIDAIQIEFNRKENDLLSQGVKEAINE